MKAVMNSSSSSPYLKQVSCKEQNLRYLSFNLKDDLFAKLPLHHSCNNHKKKNVNFKLAISVSSTGGGVLPVSLSSSQNQAEVEKPWTKAERSHGQTVHVVFQLQRECSFGQNFLIVGDDPMFGLWDPNNAVPLTWSDGHLWTVELDIPTRKCIKFKFIMQEGNGRFIWQPGPDRILVCWETDKIITLYEDWENLDLRTITEADPTFNQVEDLATSIDSKTISADKVMPIEPSVSNNDDLILKTSSSIAQMEEPEGYAINFKEVLASDEAVPVLVPGLSHMPMEDNQEEELATEAVKDEPEAMNGGAVMVSAGADIANDLKLPEFNSNPRPVIPSIHENQDFCENQPQEVAEEQDQEVTKPINSLLLNDNRHQDLCENQLQELAEEQDQEVTQPMKSLLLDDNRHQDLCENQLQELAEEHDQEVTQPMNSLLLNNNRNQHSCENQLQQLAKEQDQEDTQPMKTLLLNDDRHQDLCENQLQELAEEQDQEVKQPMKSLLLDDNRHQDLCENQLQELAEEQDQEIAQPMKSLLLNDNRHPDSYENQLQEPTEEQDNPATLPMKSLLLNDFGHGKRVLKKLLSIFGIE